MAIVFHTERDTKTGLHELHVIPVTSDMFEYFCTSCKQLRLSCKRDRFYCGACKSKDIITGPVGSLDKAKLISNLTKDG